jgi:hypothetical protein
VIVPSAIIDKLTEAGPLSVKAISVCVPVAFLSSSLAISKVAPFFV